MGTAAGAAVSVQAELVCSFLVPVLTVVESAEFIVYAAGRVGAITTIVSMINPLFANLTEAHPHIKCVRLLDCGYTMMPKKLCGASF